MTTTSPLVSAEDVLAGGGEAAVLDATWFLGEKKGRDAYEESHLPGAAFFDIDEVARDEGDLPHMLPSPEAFAEAAGPLIGSAGEVVVYDASPLRSAARAFWTMRVMGIEAVSVLNGGKDAWRAAGGTLTTETTPPRAGHPKVRRRADRVVDREELRGLLGDPGVLVIDARSEGRFAGRDPEPRAGLSSGHMPGAVNLPFQKLYDEAGKMRPKGELKALFAPFEPEGRTRIIATCGSGVTACSLLLALSVLGHEQLALYDGSWAEWASSDEKIVKD